MTSSGNEGTLDKIERVIGESDNIHSLGSDNSDTVSGLNSVGSQVPDELSQTMALDRVDKLLLDYDVGSPKEVDAGNFEPEALPSVSKGAQSLARKADRLISVSTARVFDWSMDEKNGDDVNKGKGIYSEIQGNALESYSSFGEKARSNLGFYRKMESLPYSVSGLTQGASIRSDNLHLSEVEAMNLCADMNEQSNSIYLQKQVESTNDVGVEAMDDVGPDTQMAAEAMEALFHGSPNNHESGDDADPVARNSSMYSTRDMMLSKQKRELFGISRECLSNSTEKDKTATVKTKHEKVKKHNSIAKYRVAEGKISSEPSELLTFRRKVRTKCRNRMIRSEPNIRHHSDLQVIEEQPEVEVKASYLMKDVFSHPKRKRKHHINREFFNDANLNKASISTHTVPTLPQRMTKVCIKRVPEIRDTAKTKRKPVSKHHLVRNDDFPYNTREVSEIFCANTRLSAGSPLKLYIQKDSHKLIEAGLPLPSDNRDATVINDRIPFKEVALVRQSSIFASCAKEAKENTKLEGLLRDKDQPLGLSFNKSLKKAEDVRKTVRVEDTETTSNHPLRELRRRKTLGSVRVLFSNNLDEDIIKKQKKIMTCLGVLMASSISDATHFITDKFARTRNMLEAIAMGKPVVTHMWLESCGQASCFIDEKKYILRDPKKEKEIGFSMPVSLARACKCPLLQGRRVFITPNVKPDRKLVACLVKATHGQTIYRVDKLEKSSSGELPDDLLVISCEEDYKACQHLVERGAEIFSSELLLSGIVIQKLEFERHRLFL